MKKKTVLMSIIGLLIIIGLCVYGFSINPVSTCISVCITIGVSYLIYVRREDIISAWETNETDDLGGDT